MKSHVIYLMRFDKSIDFELLFAIGYNSNRFVNIIINAHTPERLQCVCMYYLNNNVTIFSSGSAIRINFLVLRIDAVISNMNNLKYASKKNYTQPRAYKKKC